MCDLHIDRLNADGSITWDMVMLTAKARKMLEEDPTKRAYLIRQMGLQMTREERDILIKKAIELWGEDSQFLTFSEEMGELLTAVSHFKRGRVNKDAVVTEIADVRIMIEEIMHIFGITAEEVDIKMDSQFEKFQGNYLKSLRKKESATTETDSV